MSTFSGTMFKGAKKVAKDLRREEAEERNARTPESRRRATRTAAVEQATS